eukprot:1490548-Alexandrium_andersonii.AAC.1
MGPRLLFGSADVAAVVWQLEAVLHVSGNRILSFRPGKVSRVRLAWNQPLVAIRMLPVGISDRARRCGSARLGWGACRCSGLNGWARGARAVSECQGAQR